MHKRLFIAAAAAALAAAAPFAATAQDFPPKKPVTLVVGFAPGGAADAAARLIAKKLAENIGQSVVVDNKGGAGGNIAHQFVAAAPADGSVLLFGSVGPLTIAPHIMKLPYDPFKDLAPVSGGVNFPNVLVVHKALGVKNLAEFVELSKKKPGSVDFASTGAGSASHLAGELFNQRAGIDMVHVPYKGSSQINTDILGGHLSMAFVGVAGVVQLVNSGQMRALAVSTSSRSSLFPDVPAVNELVPGFDVDSWYGLMAPAGTPQPIIDRLAKEASAVLADPQLAKIYRDNGLEPEGTSPAEYTEKIASELTRWKAVIDSAGLGQ